MWARPCRRPSTRGPASATYLIGVKAHVPELAPLQPLHQGHLLICQLHVVPCHPILHGAPGGPPAGAMS